MKKSIKDYTDEIIELERNIFYPTPYMSELYKSDPNFLSHLKNKRLNLVEERHKLECMYMK